MTDAKVTPYPKTPAAVASAALDAIENQPGAFDMDHWVWLPDTISLPPEEAPPCGSLLCAASWTAHVTGWTLVPLPVGEKAEVTAVDDDGTEYVTHSEIYAERGNERRLISEVAAKALGLKPDEDFWNVSATAALDRLREIAGR